MGVNMVNKQQLRRSQFVLVYGPGSLIETTNGSRLIPSLKGLGDNCNDEFFEYFELKDIRMNQLLNRKNVIDDYDCRLVSIPSNTAVSDDKPRAIYSTLVFPKWHICYEREPPILYNAKKSGENECVANKDFDKKCTTCKKDTNPNVRFIRACPNGHLDEVYWWKEVHENQKEECKFDDYYYWKAGGGKLEDIIIECPKCGSTTTMRKIYQNRRRCTGRHPEKEEFDAKKKITFGQDVRTWDCEEKMSVIQKQSTSLRIPVTRTLLKIPKADKPILNSLVNGKMRIYLEDRNPEDLTKEQIIEKAYKYAINDVDDVKDYFENHTVEQFFEDMNKGGIRKNYQFKNAIDEEFVALKKNEESENFKKGDWEEYPLNVFGEEFPIEVCGVDTLTTVTAQTHYQRKPHLKEKKTEEDEEDYEYIDVGYVVPREDGEEIEEDEFKIKWYPAYIGVGEGIFLYSKKNPLMMFPQLEKTKTTWEECSIPKNKEREELTDPLFVWWHTLSHALIKSLSLSCGYSSPSLRERVYINEEGEGGILIYNTSPGDDSGMGGLYDIVYNKKEFCRVLDNAMDIILNCSNDPLCSSIKQEADSVNGSACHNCLLISETSCEHINKYLDRHFFIG